MDINCVSLINNLNKAARQYNLSVLAQVVYLRLWERHNLNRWKDQWISYTDAQLMQDTHEKSRQRLYRAKKELESVHLLIHKVGVNRTSMYTLVALEPQGIAGNERTQNVHNSDISRTQTDTLIKDNRLKSIDNNKKEIYKEKDETSKPKKKAYGEYKKVLLTDEELEKLKTEFPNDWQDWIDRVDGYCAQNGKRYTNYLATIRNCARKDKANGEIQRPLVKTPQGKVRGRYEFESDERLDEFLKMWGDG